MKYRILYLLALLAICSCQNDDDLTELSGNQETQNSISMGEQCAIKAAKDFVASLSAATRSIEDKEVGDVYAWLSKDFCPTTRSSLISDLPDTLFYIVNFKNDDGYVLVNARDTFGCIYAYIENGHLTPTDTIDNDDFRQFLDRIQVLCALEYPDPDTPLPPDTAITIPNPINPDPSGPIDQAIGIWRIDAHIAPLLTVKWHQRDPFNRYCFTNYGQQAVAGCVAISAAQIAAYHRYPSAYNGHTYNWEAICQGVLPATETGKDGAAHLVHDIGVLVGMNYGVTASRSYNSVMWKCWDAFGYHSSYGNYDYDLCLEELEDGRPVVLGGYSYNPNAGHSWVVDGAMERNYYVPLMTLGGVSDEIIQMSQKMLHCNWGWNGKYNGYYLNDAFCLDEIVLTDALNDNFETVTTHLNFDDGLDMVYQIYPLSE